ncbi:uncharacterized protein LOC111912829 [Lactuca sativa]|uniref:uncharacterized protein LOC111912829 n=1 Tax=Lactuca sativa TaxID=4236 RepID=UPI000CD93FBF|nr:uncharacterized protein LOC111912829 [Lactuca sativa]
MENRYEYFQIRHDAKGERGFTGLQKCVAAIKLMSLEESSDSIDDYMRIHLKSAKDEIDHLESVTIVAFIIVSMPPKSAFGSTSNNPNVTLNDQLQVLIYTATNHRLDAISENLSNLIDMPTNQHVNQPPPPSLPPPLPTTPSPLTPSTIPLQPVELKPPFPSPKELLPQPPLITT